MNDQIKHKKCLTLFLFSLYFLIFSAPLFAHEIKPPNTDISGYLKTLSFWTRTSTASPELLDSPQGASEANESLFSNTDRLRLKFRTHVDLPYNQRLLTKIDYDHQASFGSFVSSGNYRYAKWLVEKGQFWDTSQTLVESDSANYEHRLYRASAVYTSPALGALEIGRQQISWGVAHFFTPTDVFNPFSPVQLEWDERDGVDALSYTTPERKGWKTQYVYTPRGRRLHPQRWMTRTSADFRGYEVGVLGGLIQRDLALGWDMAGNIKDSAVRGEFLFRSPDGTEKEFIKFTLNADYNFPKNIYALLEYHFNGQGKHDERLYQRDRQLRGEIRDLARNYLALLLGHDLTPLLRFENRAIFNLDDVSFYLRPELRYELKTNLLLTAASQLYLGANRDEYGTPKNLYFTDMKYSF